MNRLSFFKIVAGAGGLATMGIVAIPAAITILSPVLTRSREERWQPVGRLEDLPINAVRKVVIEISRDDSARSLREKAVYVWRRSEEQVVVFSRNCTDLSCPITWDEASGWFYCPCHGGIFARNGERMAGPPKRALFRYANRIRNGVVEIDLDSLPPMT